MDDYGTDYGRLWSRLWMIMVQIMGDYGLDYGRLDWISSESLQNIEKARENNIRLTGVIT